MIYLIGSIILSSYLTLSFKMVEKLGINTFQAIVCNYLTCVITGILMHIDHPFRTSLIMEPWFPWAIVMGVLFIGLFNIIGITAQRNGVAAASVANKLSLVIPFIFSFFLYGEQVSSVKIAGVLLALLAVVWVTTPPAVKGAAKTWAITVPLLPLILFFGSGLLDTLIKFVEIRFLNGSNNNDYLVIAFGGAAIIGVLTESVQIIRGKSTLSWKALLAGIAIGIPNFFSIWCLVNVLKVYAGKSSVIIPVNNMAVVAISTLAATVLFQEKLSSKNWLGIILSLAAITLIAFG